MRATAQIAALALALAGCPRPAESPTPTPGTADEPRPATAPDAALARSEDGGATALEPSADIPLGEVRALLDRWVAAQNASDLEGYRRLYAARFEGVKRAGDRVYRFDRDGWLADRARMFAGPVRVEASDVRIATTASTAVVTFTQRWASATFQDEGPKQLVVVREGGSLRISREEMMRSEVLSRGGTAAPGIESLLLVVGADRPAVVLARSSDPGWATGSPRLLTSEDPADLRAGPIVVARSVAPRELSEDLRRWEAREVVLHGPTGPLCTGRLEAPLVVRWVVPHFSTRIGWDGTELGLPRAPRDRVVREAWELGEGSDLLVAPVASEAEGCAGALWARPVGTPEPTTFVPVAAPFADAAEAVRALPAHRLARPSFEAVGRAAGPWLLDPAVSTRATRWRNPSSGRAFVTAEVWTDEGCGGIDVALWGLFEDVAGRLVHRAGGRDLSRLRPLAVFDLDGDGLVEMLATGGAWDPFSRVLLRPSRTGYAPALRVAPAFLDCGC